MTIVPELPMPGEVWIVVEQSTGPETWQSIQEERPFIVTYVSTAYVGYVCAASGPGAEEGKFARVGPRSFPWDEHCARLWPSLPSWEELRAGPLAEDDLRAQASEHPQ